LQNLPIRRSDYTKVRGEHEMMKKYFVITILILITYIMSACSPQPTDSAPTSESVSDTDKPITVCLSWNRKDSSLPVAWEDRMKQTSAEIGEKIGRDFKWIVNVADGDPSRQNANIEDCINQGVDIIVSRAEDSTAIGAAIKASQDAGIPFITFDRESSADLPDAHVGADSYSQAVMAGEAMADLLEKNGIEGKCLELQGDLRDINAVNRSAGWKKVEEERGAWETVIQVPTEWLADKFMNGTVNSLTAHPEINCMFVHADFLFSSVKAGMEMVDRLHPVGEEGHIWLATQDVLPEGYTGLLEGYIDINITYDAYLHSDKLIEVIVKKVVDGETWPLGEKFLVQGRLVTPENVETTPDLWARDYMD
jgi:ribose transport system substrate-binding protein